MFKEAKKPSKKGMYYLNDMDKELIKMRFEKL